MSVCFSLVQISFMEFVDINRMLDSDCYNLTFTWTQLQNKFSLMECGVESKHCNDKVDTIGNLKKNDSLQLTYTQCVASISLLFKILLITPFQCFVLL